MSVPQDLLYSKEHEWIRFEGDIAVVGITDYAQHALGDIVYVELPRPGKAIEAASAVGVVESVKSVSDLFTPITGEVVEINTALDTDAALVNRAAFSDGWMFKVKVAADVDRSALLDAASYESLIAEAG